MDAFTHRHVSERNPGSQNLDTHFAGTRVREVVLDKFQATVPIHDDASVFHVRKLRFNVANLQEANIFVGGPLLVRMEAESVMGLPHFSCPAPGKAGQEEVTTRTSRLNH
jgi:hypothetical protein